jgi:hypothetical protein
MELLQALMGGTAPDDRRLVNHEPFGIKAMTIEPVPA